MATVTLRGTPVETSGDLPTVGAVAPEFTLVLQDLSETTLADYKGKRVILNIFPSSDTPTCQKSVRSFNEKATALDNTVVLCVSPDLPFAQARFCEAESIKNVTTASNFRSADFGKHYGLTFVTGPLTGLLARAVVIIDTNGKILYNELVPEIAQEPNYDAVLAAL
jgi:thiol peroxidase